MNIASRYWFLVNLSSSGKLKITEIDLAKSFFQQQFGEIGDRTSEGSIQQELFTQRQNKNKDSTPADCCLRCFISHIIRQICIQLDSQFGREHNFSRYDLFIYTLNDTLDNFRSGVKTVNSAYKPLAVEILETFDPQKANLATWTTRYVKQNRELQRFLLEQGVYLISNWAILNDTKSKQIARILAEFHNLTPTEIDRAKLLLIAYHNVYRRDRLKNRQGKGGKCQPPSREQLTRITSLIAPQGLVLSPEEALLELEQLANLLREYRIYARGGQMPSESFDNTEQNTEAMQKEIATDSADINYSDFLKSYKQQLQQSLDRAIATVITTRTSKFKGKKAAKAPQFLTALKLLHCQRESMGAIAPKVGLAAQYQVTRLLKLKELRVDIRHQMLLLMQDWTMEQSQLTDLASLKAREQAIASVLGEQIDGILAEAEKELSIADSPQGLLSQRICQYLDGY